jgi:RNA polymerase sigma-70 factor (ECF subfamily)
VDSDWEKLYRRNADLVFRFLMSRCHDRHLAEDLTADTFLEAWRCRERYNGSCKVSVWLCQIAKNRYLSEQRKRKPEPLSDTLESAEPSPESLAVRSDEAERVSEAVHRLDEPYKEVFLLRVYGEMPFENIGRLFGKTANWACVTFHRAKAKIKAELEEKQ